MLQNPLRNQMLQKQQQIVLRQKGQPTIQSHQIGQQANYQQMVKKSTFGNNNLLLIHDKTGHDLQFYATKKTNFY